MVASPKFRQNSISSKRKMLPTKVVGKTQTDAKLVNRVGFARSVKTSNHKPNPKIANDFAINQIYKNMNKLELRTNPTFKQTQNLNKPKSF